MENSKQEIIKIINNINEQTKKLSNLIPSLESREEKIKSLEGTIKNAVDIRTSAERTIQGVLRADIHDLKAHEFFLSNALELANDIINTIHEPLVLLDKNLSVVLASKSFYTTFNVKESETKNEKIFNLGNKQWDIPLLRDMLNDVLLKSKTFENFKVKHTFPKVGKKTMLLNARKVTRRIGEHYILLAIEDVTK